jgi:4'-phosphopantetheinyl transferase
MKTDKTENSISGKKNYILHPVILAVPDAVKDLIPKERVKFLSRHARRALEMSADKSGIRLDDLQQDERNAPLPFRGTYWSITHKNEYVGGVVSPSPTGIDIEKIGSRAKSLFRKTADGAEWAMADTTFTTFFRYWTAKEAVLKAVGIGLRDLSKCRISRVRSAHHLDVEYEGNKWQIEHNFFNNHIASIVKNDFVVQWTIC